MNVLLLAIVLALAAGHAVAGALLWALVHVPESNVPMLLVSAILAVAGVAVIGWVELVASLTWLQRESLGPRARRAVVALPAFVLGSLLFLGVWWATGHLTNWLAGIRGEIDAAIMARTGVTRTAWLHSALAWTVWGARYGVGLSLALTLMVAGVLGGPRSVLGLSWVRRALSPRQLVLILVLVLAFIALPWQVVYWRPGALLATWLEPAFVAVKLLLLYLLAHVGWALVLRTAALGAARAGGTPTGREGGGAAEGVGVGGSGMSNEE